MAASPASPTAPTPRGAIAALARGASSTGFVERKIATSSMCSGKSYNAQLKRY
jgi:hypothetical protein